MDEEQAYYMAGGLLAAGTESVSFPPSPSFPISHLTVDLRNIQFNVTVCNRISPYRNKSPRRTRQSNRPKPSPQLHRRTQSPVHPIHNQRNPAFPSRSASRIPPCNLQRRRLPRLLDPRRYGCVSQQLQRPLRSQETSQPRGI